MTIYCFLAITSLIFALLYHGGNRKVFFILLIVLCFLGAFRDNTVGTDTRYVYSYNYQNSTMDPKTWNAFTEFEPGFNYMMSFFKMQIIDDFKLFYGLLFLVTFSFFAWFIKKKAINPLLGLSFFIWLGYYTTEFNIMRQYFGLSIICWGIVQFLEKRKYVYYTILCIVVGFLIHRSLLLFVIANIFYLDYVKRLLTNKVLTVTLVFSMVGFFVFKSVFSNLLSSIIPILNIERYQGYIQNSLNNETEISPIMIMLQSLFCLLVIFLDRKKSIYFYLFYFGIVLRNCIIQVVPITFRLVDSFMFFSFIVFANLYENIDVKYRLKVRSCILIYCFIYFYLAMIRNYNEVIPYKNYLLNYV